MVLSLSWDFIEVFIWLFVDDVALVLHNLHIIFRLQTQVNSLYWSLNLAAKSNILIFF